MSTEFLGKAYACNFKAFSLTEILLTFLVMCLLMAAIIPAITKKTSFKEKVNQIVLTYGDINCPEVPDSSLSAGNASCNGNFTVPNGVTELIVTVIGAGGGGGAGNASGYAEYTTPGTSSFIVPYGSVDINATLISGGAGGGAGGVVAQTAIFTNVGSNTLDVSKIKGHPNAPMFVTLIGGGGGGGGGGWSGGAGGGSGAYYNNFKISLPLNYSANTIPVIIGAAGTHGLYWSYGSKGGGATTVGSAPWGISAGGGGGGGGERIAGSNGENPLFLQPNGLTSTESGGAGGSAWSEGVGYGGIPSGNNGSPGTNTGSGGVGNIGGNGASSPLGQGGIFKGSNQQGGNATGYGAGGSGSNNTNPNPEVKGGDGSPGYAKIFYLEPGPGGSGGGGAALVPGHRITAMPSDTLSITVAPGGKGGTAGYINSSGIVVNPTEGMHGANPSYISKSGAMISFAGYLGNNYNCQAQGGTPTGQVFSPSFQSGMGWILSGVPTADCDNVIAPDSFSNSSGKTAGNGTTPGTITYANGSTGGDGGIVKTPWFTCTPGAGGTSSSPDGGNGQGYGCGGGGGYGLGKGGDGSGGYARLEYNPSNIGSGGGGGAGLGVKKISMTVTSGEAIPYTIGAGGAGGKISGSVSTPAKQGGATTFGAGSRLIQAGGGLGGGNVSTSSNTIINGLAGDNAPINTCIVLGSTSALCKATNTAISGSNSKGGNGADSIEGKGGAGGSSSDNLAVAEGKTSTPKAGAGGSGAATYINPPVSMSIPIYPQGGQGGHGVIIIQWR